jgi:UDP-N-acetylmuramoyl-L-alanyl-D-glutamate--2,6-diaminopimelate ligase
MLLHTLLRQLNPPVDIASLPDVELSGIQEDSRLVKAGDLFIARHGTQTDGARFIADAQARGAAAVISQTAVQGCSIPVAIVPDLASSSQLGNLFFSRPSDRVKVVGVTGTNGKTTTTYLLRHLLAKAGIRCGLVGTVEIDDGINRREATMTTPGAVELARLLAAMREAQCAACAMEVSSHALHQQRVAGIRFAAAGFSNLTQDHLDYHLTMENYAAAKALLFASLDAGVPAVVNAEDAWSEQMVRNCRARVVKFGFGNDADYRAHEVTESAQGTQFILAAPGGRATVQMQLVGRHNVENALLAAALAAETFGMSAPQIAQGLRDTAGAPGRLQEVNCEGQSFTVLVDYAHTDDALENVLSALKPLCKGKLRVLFGCGGDRDRKKRPLMGQKAQKWADALYVTSDNPRSEDPQAIIEEIMAGLSDAKGVVVEADRRSAIRRIIGDAGPGDVVLLAGKGHENYQIVGSQKRHFDDVEEAALALKMRQALPPSPPVSRGRGPG